MTTEIPLKNFSDFSDSYGFSPEKVKTRHIFQEGLCSDGPVVILKL